MPQAIPHPLIQRVTTYILILRTENGLVPSDCRRAAWDYTLALCDEFGLGNSPTGRFDVAQEIHAAAVKAANLLPKGSIANAETSIPLS